MLAEANELVGDYYAEMAASDSVARYLRRAEQLYARDTSRFATYYALSARIAVSTPSSGPASCTSIRIKSGGDCRAH